MVTKLTNNVILSSFVTKIPIFSQYTKGDSKGQNGFFLPKVTKRRFTHVNPLVTVTFHITFHPFGVYCDILQECL